MKKILLLVEGFTEERFVNEILQPHFGNYCFLTPVLVKTRRDDTGRVYKGGYVTYTQFKKQILNLLRDSSATAVTTMLDYHALASDFPGKKTVRKLRSLKQAVDHIEQQVSDDISDGRFLPYLSCPQIEALLFADVEVLYARLSAVCPKLDSGLIQKSSSDPEEINAQNPPAKLLSDACSNFVKSEHTIDIAKEIGLEKILQRCAHFRQWVEKLRTVCEADG